MHTTAGDLELELWATQCPLTCRNFLQLCLDDYYTDTIFHRLVSGFIVQGGDPSGTGHGGEAIYPGGLFADEFHSRLKFNRRGLLGMANSGKPDDNGSQFFFTLAETKELNGKNTLFGKVVGETIYNLVKIGERELEEEGSERMLYPVKVTGVEVLVNPFDDMVRRAAVQKGGVREEMPKKATIGKKKAAGKKGKPLLSFGGEDGDEEEILPVKKIKFDNRLVSAIPETQKKTTLITAPVKPPAVPRTCHSPTPSISRSPSPQPVPTPRLKAKKLTKPLPVPSRSQSPESKPRESFLAKTTAQIEALKASLKRRDNDTMTTTAAPKKRSLLALQKEMLPSTSVKGRKRKRLGKGKGGEVDDDDAMDALERFRRKLEKATSPPSTPTPPLDTPTIKQSTTITTTPPDSKDEEEYQLCDLHFIPHCQSCKSWDEAHANDSTLVDSAVGEDDIRPEDFLGHTLRFEKDRLGKDLNWKKEHEYDDGLVLIDPREKSKELAEQRVKERAGRGAGRYGASGAGGAGGGGSSREWDKGKRGRGGGGSRGR